MSNARVATDQRTIAFRSLCRAVYLVLCILIRGDGAPFWRGRCAAGDSCSGRTIEV